MINKKWLIKGLKSDYRQEVEIIADIVHVLIDQTVFLHNRDFPDDPWIAGELPDEAGNA